MERHLTMQDEALSRFALAVAPVAAAILAITGALLIFLLDQRQRNEIEAFRRVRSYAHEVAEFLETQAGKSYNYAVQAPDFKFLSLLARIADAILVKDIPGYILWRTQTAEVLTESQKVSARKALVDRQVTNNDKDLFEFQDKFVRLLLPLDEAIQDLDWAVGLRLVGVKKAMIGAMTAAALLLTSLVMGLAALVESSGRIPDQWNIVGGGLLVVLTIFMCLALYRSFRENALSRQEWISKVIEKAR